MRQCPCNDTMVHDTYIFNPKHASWYVLEPTCHNSMHLSMAYKQASQALAAFTPSGQASLAVSPWG
jgi:hypothetical protein